MSKNLMRDSKQAVEYLAQRFGRVPSKDAYRNWIKKGQLIPDHRLPGGQLLFSKTTLDAFEWPTRPKGQPEALRPKTPKRQPEPKLPAEPRSERQKQAQTKTATPCVQCGEPISELALIERDEYCRAECCREAHDVPSLPDERLAA